MPVALPQQVRSKALSLHDNETLETRQVQMEMKNKQKIKEKDKRSEKKMKKDMYIWSTVFDMSLKKDEIETYSKLFKLLMKIAKLGFIVKEHEDWIMIYKKINKKEKRELESFSSPLYGINRTHGRRTQKLGN